MNSGDALKFLLLGGFLGLFGQGVRALVGLNLLKDYANAPNPSQNDVFNAARLAISLVVGFLAGIAAALTYILKGSDVSSVIPFLLPFAGAGYIGTDVIEAFYVKYFDKGSTTGLKAPQTQPDAGSSDSVTALEQIKPGLLAGRAAPPPGSTRTSPPPPAGLQCGGVYVGAVAPTTDKIRTYVLAVAGKQYTKANTPDKTPISPTIRGGADVSAEFAAECRQYSVFKNDGLTFQMTYADYCTTIGDFIDFIQCCYKHPIIPRPGA
jgi:hypothetical protein